MKTVIIHTKVPKEIAKEIEKLSKEEGVDVENLIYKLIDAEIVF